MARTATIVGYHGKLNIGDDMFFIETCRWAFHRGVSRCFVMGDRKVFPEDCSGVQVETFENPMKMISRFQWFKIISKALRSDYLIFSAGSIFTIQPFLLIYLSVLLIRSIKRRRIKVIAIGVSIGPFQSSFDQYWCGKVVELMDEVLLRDERSSKVLEKKGTSKNCFLSHDLALPYLNNQKSTIPLPLKSLNKIIGVSLTQRGLGFCDKSHSVDCNHLSEVLIKYIAENPSMKIRLYSVCGDEKDGDEKLCKHFRSKLTDAGFKRIESVYYDGININEITKSIQSCDLMISYRMHAGVVAMFGNVPLFQISYSEKIRDFFKNNLLDLTYVVDNLNYKELDKFISISLKGGLSAYTISQKEKLERSAVECEKMLYEIL